MLKNSNYVFGPKNLSVPVHLNSGQYIFEKLMEYKDRTALINGLTKETMTYGQIADQAMSVALSLSRMGIGKGDTVGICSENRSEFMPAVIGTMFTGAVLTTINVLYSKDEMRHVMNISKPSAIFVSPVVYPQQEKNLKSIPSIKKIILFGDRKPSNEILYKDMLIEKASFENFQVADVNGQTDTTFILYSSGTTGLPKGVMLTHLNVLACCKCLEVELHREPVVAFTIAPWFHAMGLLGMLSSYCNSRTMVYLPKYEEKAFLQSIQDHKPELLVLVPPLIVLLSKTQLLADYDISSAQYIYSGGAMIDMETIQDVKKRLPNLKAVLQGYGMTETTLSVTKDNAYHHVPCREGSVGSLHPGTIAKIVDIESRKPLGPNQQGEICFKGPLVMKGYVGRNMADELDEEGFLKTGDIGYYDEDRFFYVVDRLKELIKYKGFQVPPAEIEAVLLQHKAIRDAAVIGVPNKAVGEVPLAFVVLRPGEQCSEEQIKEFVASKLSNPKHLRGGVRFIEEIPKNPSGKILRRILRDLAKKGKSKL